MIITKLTGGLGNQMFQYAAGRRAAYKNNTKVKLDISWYEKKNSPARRRYALEVFKIKENLIATHEIQGLTYLKQRHFHFDPQILKVSDNTCLDGSWQSEKYFQDIEAFIRQEFTFKKKPGRENKKNIKKIFSVNAVSVHIRCGDYLFDKETHEFHGVCPLDYYSKAASFIAHKIRQPHFIVFSDDPRWVEKNFRLDFPFTIITTNFRKKDYEDLRLMTLCKNNIIANSTFSWWGAWLNTNPNKIVIAPKNWFKNQQLNTKDLIPKSWLKI